MKNLLRFLGLLGMYVFAYMYAGSYTEDTREQIEEAMIIVSFCACYRAYSAEYPDKENKL